MSSTDELKALAVSTHDFYALLSVGPTFTEAELGRARRQAALKYHPDKAGDDKTLLDKFYLAEAGYEILRDRELRSLYDSTRNAREQQRLRDEALHGERRRMKERLDAAERRGGAKQAEAGERDLGGDDEESRLRRKLRCLREDAERRKGLLEAERRREQLKRAAAAAAVTSAATSGRPEPTDRGKTGRASGMASAERAREDDGQSPFVGRDGDLSLHEQVVNRLRQQAA